VARHRCATATIRIGRAYDNDIVIDDPYVAPHHLQVTRDPAGAWRVEDLGTLNGLLVDGARTPGSSVALDGERVLQIGRTQLRLRDTAYPVAPERAAQAERRQWPILAALMIALLGASGLSQWLTETAEPQLSRYLLPLLALPVFALGWSALWAILARIFAGRARFERNLMVALSGLLAYWLYNTVLNALGFALAWRRIATYQEIGIWCLAGLIVFAHLRVLGPSRPWLKAATAGGLAAVMIALHLVSQADRMVNDQQSLLRDFMPPALRLTALHDENTFFGDVQTLKRRLDRDRLEDQPASPLAILGRSDD
jgi:hypothetical protein